MSKIIKEREHKTEIYYERHFQVITEKTLCGFCFACDEKGNVILSNEAQKENYKYCLEHPEKYIDYGAKKRIHNYIDPAILLCDCGEHVYLTSFTNTCDKCETDYNIQGNRLASRSQWGYETGENWTDCY